MSLSPFEFSNSITNLGIRNGRVSYEIVNDKNSSLRENMSNYYSNIVTENVGQPFMNANTRQRFIKVPNKYNFTSQGRVKGRFRNKTKVACQLYGKTGHMVAYCYHRFDIHFNRPIHNQNHQTNNPIIDHHTQNTTYHTNTTFYTSQTL